MWHNQVVPAAQLATTRHMRISTFEPALLVDAKGQRIPSITPRRRSAKLPSGMRDGSNSSSDNVRLLHRAKIRHERFLEALRPLNVFDALIKRKFKVPSCFRSRFQFLHELEHA